jgi:hypothetical protein
LKPSTRPSAAALDIGRPAAADDLCAQLPRANGQRHGDAGRVDMAVIGRVQRAEHAIEIVERMQLAWIRPAHKLHREAERTADAQGLVKPVHLVFGVGEAERAAAMPGDGLAGLGLQLPGIEIDVVTDAPAKP